MWWKWNSWIHVCVQYTFIVTESSCEIVALISLTTRLKENSMLMIEIKRLFHQIRFKYKCIEISYSLQSQRPRDSVFWNCSCLPSFHSSPCSLLTLFRSAEWCVSYCSYLVLRSSRGNVTWLREGRLSSRLISERDQYPGVIKIQLYIPPSCGRSKNLYFLVLTSNVQTKQRWS